MKFIQNKPIGLESMSSFRHAVARSNKKITRSSWLPAGVGAALFGLLYAKLSLTWWWPLAWLVSLVFALVAAAYTIEAQIQRFRARPRSSGKDTCLITGGTHGIGFALAKMFARDGYNLIIVARYEEELQQAKQDLLRINPSISVLTMAKDLYSENGAQKLFEEINATNEIRGGQFHINHLVNNVGMCIRGSFLELPLIDQIGMMQLNMKNCVVLCHLFGNQFKDEIDRSPLSTSMYRILNLSSFASVIVCPFLSVYSGTKAFVHSFSVAFAEELKAGKYDGRISCTSLCPGYTASPALPPCGIPHSVAWALKNHDTPDRVAKTGYKAMMEGRYCVLVGMLNNFTYWMTSTVLPVTWASKLGKFFNSDWEDLSWKQIRKEGLTVKRGWKGDSVDSKDLRAGLAKQ